MKKYSWIIVIMVASISSFYSCKRDYTMRSPYSTTEGSSYLRIIDAAPNFRNIFNAPDSFNVLINGSKVAGYTPGAALVMTFGSNFPSISSGYGYIAVPPGTQEIKISTGILNPDSVSIARFSKTFEANKYYTFIITDSIKSNRDSSQIFLQDVYTQPESGFFNLRFIHAVLNDTAGKSVDIYSKRAAGNIFTNVKPGTISPFSKLPYTPFMNDTLYVRRAGSTTLTLDTLNTVSFINQRTYTLFYRGDGTSNSNSNVKRRHLATYAH
ncbi:MAG: DUF4397 domain-containing protein [Bacteroidota bacterium]|nr:DUF4397 domain-containing protein [Bacteroidota bacterium]